MESHPNPAAVGAATTLVRLEGRDALEVLHRISTQSLADLSPGEVRMTLFCDFRGRLLHRAAVASTAAGTSWLVRDDAPPHDLVAYVDRHVFREEVRIADASAPVLVRPVEGGFGRSAGTLIESDGIPVELQTSADFGYRIETAGAGSLDPASEVRRIQAGRPRHGHEVEPSFDPFEVGLAHEVHLHKGCYTGQEALMRMVTYRGTRRRLARLRGSGAVPSVPREVRSAGDVVGRLTSAAADETGWIALAVLRSEALAPGTRLEIEAAGAVESAASFAETRPLGLP